MQMPGGLKDGAQTTNVVGGYAVYASSDYADRINGDYRYAYNGMEVDNELSGNGNSYTTEFRQYDPRLGRWKSLDPLMIQFPSMSPYCAFDNNPVFFIDPYGLSAGGPGEDPKIQEQLNAAKSLAEKEISKENPLRYYISPKGTLFTNDGTGWVQNIENAEATGYKDGIDPNEYYVLNDGNWEVAEHGFITNNSYSGEAVKAINEWTFSASWDDAARKVEAQFHGYSVEMENERIRQLKMEVQFSNNPFYLIHEIGPTGSIDDVYDNISNGSYASAGIIAFLELAPGEFDNIIKSGKNLNSSILKMSAKQLQKKFKHALDFGVLGQYNKVKAAQFSAAINQHVNRAGNKFIFGTYRGQRVLHILNPDNKLNVIVNPDGSFYSPPQI